MSACGDGFGPKQWSGVSREGATTSTPINLQSLSIDSDNDDKVGDANDDGNGNAELGKNDSNEDSGVVMETKPKSNWQS